MRYLLRGWRRSAILATRMTPWEGHSGAMIATRSTRHIAVDSRRPTNVRRVRITDLLLWNFIFVALPILLTLYFKRLLSTNDALKCQSGLLSHHAP